jgi:hypothetical protein
MVLPGSAVVIGPVVDGRLPYKYNTKDKFSETAQAWRRTIHIFMYQTLAHMVLHIVLFHRYIGLGWLLKI